jgi:hypothetical protein
MSIGLTDAAAPIAGDFLRPAPVERRYLPASERFAEAAE